MSEPKNLFRAGQLVETRSFQPGYRGAWFRCKIKETARRKGSLGHSLQYCDFPDEKIRWTKLYQVPSYSSRSHRRTTREIMLRPEFPPVYRESEMPNINSISEIVVVVNDTWKMGDLVDWWTDDCFWSGRICKLLEKEKVQIQLHPPPYGEGCLYDVSCNDLRPSLDWSPESGWVVPIPEDSETRGPCARLIKQPNKGNEKIASRPESLSSHNNDESTTGIVSLVNQSTESVAKSSCSKSDLMEGHASKRKADSETKDSDDISSSQAKNVSDRLAGSIGRIEEEKKQDPKKRTDGVLPQNIMFSNTLEAALFDLEELVNKIRWMKSMLRPGSARSSWKYLEQSASSSTPN